MRPRELYARIPVGSHLYGYATDTSDHDYLDLYVPSVMELVANKRVTISQLVTDDTDVRGMLLGEFVMGLGTNPENSLIAMHYQDELPDPSLWLRKQTAFRLIEVAEKMLTHGGKVKMHATAFRYIAGAIELAEDGTLSYPMSDEHLKTIRWILDESPEDIGYHWEGLMALVNDSSLRNDDIEYEALADWTMKIYMEAHSR